MMDRLTKRQQQIAEERMAVALGRPPRVCPECGELGAHWVAARLDDAGDPIPGYFECRPVPVVPATEGLF